MRADLDGFLRARRSVRRFTADPVPLDIVQRLIETAACSPSAHNRQPWRFAIITQSSSKSELSEAMATAFRRDLERDGLPTDEVQARVRRSLSRIVAAPVIIVICMDLADMDSYPDPTRQEAERIMAVQSVAMAGLQLLLAAQAEGLAGVWNCGPLFAPGAVQAALRLPDSWEPQGMLMMGYPAEQPTARARKPVEEIAVIR